MPQIVIYTLAGALAAAAFYIVAIVLASHIRPLSLQPQWHTNGPWVLGARAAAIAFVAVVWLGIVSTGGNTCHARPSGLRD